MSLYLIENKEPKMSSNSIPSLLNIVSFALLDSSNLENSLHLPDDDTISPKNRSRLPPELKEKMKPLLSQFNTCMQSQEGFLEILKKILS